MTKKKLNEDEILEAHLLRAANSLRDLGQMADHVFGVCHDDARTVRYAGIPSAATVRHWANELKNQAQTCLMDLRQASETCEQLNCQPVDFRKEVSS